MQHPSSSHCKTVSSSCTFVDLVRYAQGKLGVDRFTSVTLIGIRIVIDFAQLAVSGNPIFDGQEEVSILNEVYALLDSLIKQYDIEIIKSGAYGYICACGIPVPTMNHVKKVSSSKLVSTY